MSLAARKINAKRMPNFNSAHMQNYYVVESLQVSLGPAYAYACVTLKFYLILNTAHLILQPSRSKAVREENST